jgi:hypothetical protein
MPVRDAAEVDRPGFSRDEFLFGLLAVRKGLVTRDQLDEAVGVCLRSRPTPRLADVLADLYRLPQAAMLRLLDDFWSLLLGSIALRRNAITDEQLIEALEIQSNSEPKPLLGAVLIALGYLTPDVLRRLLEEQESTLTKAFRPSTPPDDPPALARRRRGSRRSVRP